VLNIPAGGWLSQPAAQPYIPALQATIPNGMNLDQWANQIGAESGFNPNIVNPTTGAQGLGQVLPSTAALPGYDVSPLTNPFDPQSNLQFASQYQNAVGMNQYSGGGYSLNQLNTPGGASALGQTTNATAPVSDPFGTGMNNSYLSGAGESGNSASSATGLPDQTGMGFADPYSQNSLNTYQDANGYPALYNGTPGEPGLGGGIPIVGDTPGSTSPIGTPSTASGSSSNWLAVLGTYAERGLIILLAVVIVGVGLWMFGSHGQAASLSSIASAIKGRASHGLR